MSESPRPGVPHLDSDRVSEEGGPKEPEKKKSRRPANTAFRQQRLKAWQPILTPKTVLPLFFAIGIIFAPIGGLLLYASSQVQEIRLEYSDCRTEAPKLNNRLEGFESMPSDHVHYAFKNSNSSGVDAQWGVRQNVNVTLRTGVRNTTDVCHIRFTIPDDMGPPVLFYYHLTNFYQNHRRYVQSFDADQLKGHDKSWSTIKNSNCDPLRGNSSAGKPYYPCGLIANSMFNDTFSNLSMLNAPNGGEEPSIYNMTKNNIGWSSDKELYGKTSYNKEDIQPPPNWHYLYPNGYTDEQPPPDLKNWEAFQVWMRTAGLPVFSKLYQRNDTTKLQAGRYEVTVEDRFPVQAYKASKSILISTRTVVGGRNPFLGIAYVVVGGLCIILGGVFTVTHLIKPRKLGDHTYLSWNNVPNAKAPAQPSTGMTTGVQRPGDA